MTSVSMRQDRTWAIPQVPGTIHRFVTVRGARLAGPLLTVLGDRSVRGFAQRLELRAQP